MIGYFQWGQVHFTKLQKKKTYLSTWVCLVCLFDYRQQIINASEFRVKMIRTAATACLQVNTSFQS